MPWLFTGLMSLLSTLFRAILASGIFKAFTHTFVTLGLLKIFSVLALGFIVYEGTSFTAQWAIDEMVIALAAVPNDFQGKTVLLMAATQLKLDMILANILSALSVSIAITTMKKGSNLVSNLGV